MKIKLFLLDSFVALASASAAVIQAGLGGPGFTAVVNDYDGDGKADPAVYEESSGSWFVACSGSNYALATISLGGAGFTPLSGDYDRDGKADPIVYQAATGNWSIRLSASNYELNLLNNFGGTSFVPVPADYDGCGGIEPAVYVSSSGAWYLWRDGDAVTITNRGVYYEVHINYNVDTRFNIGKLYAQKTIQAVPEFESHLDSYLKDLADDLRVVDTNLTDEVICGRARAIEPGIPSLYLEEFEGFASLMTGTVNVFGDGKLSRDELLALNLMPDVFTTVSCSGLAVFGQRSATGRPIIGRNFDWELGTDGLICRFNAVIYSAVGQIRVCSIGVIGIMGCATGLNDSGLFAGILISPVEAEYSAEGKRSCLFDIRHVLESEQTLGGAAAFIASPTNLYAYHFLVYMADKYESRILENDLENRRGLRGHDSALNPGVIWGFNNAIAVVNSFVLSGNTDNHTVDPYNYERWNNYRTQLQARGATAAFDDVKDIMSYHGPGGEANGDIFNTYTVMSMVYSYAENRLAVFFHTATNTFTENPQFIDVPVGFTP